MKTTTTLTLSVSLACGAFAHEAIDKQAPVPETTRPKVEVCFVLDTTGSMGGLIAGAKEKIWSIANDLTASKPTPELKVALVGYRDRGDDYITKKFDLTDDLDDVYDKLMGFEAKGGGDTPESVNQGLYEAVTQIAWSKDKTTLKLVFLVGDCPPHMDYQDDIKYPETCKLAVKNDIIINTVQCGASAGTTPIWKEIAQASEGSFAAIAQNGGMAAIASPVDAEIAKLTHAINGTVIACGNVHQQTATRKKLANAGAASVASNASRGAYLSTNFKGRAISGRGDLLADLEDGTIELEKLPTDQLPEEYRGLTKEELNKIVMEKKAEREKLQAQMDELVAQRKVHVAKELGKRKGKKSSFDDEIRRAVKEQGARKGMEYSGK